MHPVVAAGEAREHVETFLAVARFAEHLAVELDQRIRAQHGNIQRARRGAPASVRLVHGQLKRLPAGSQRAVRRLVDSDREDGIAYPDLIQQRAAALRLGREVDVRGHVIGQ